MGKLPLGILTEWLNVKEWKEMRSNERTCTWERTCIWIWAARSDESTKPSLFIGGELSL